MSFNFRDLMVDVRPNDRFNPLARPAFAACGQATAAGEEEEKDDLDCGQATAGGNDSYAPGVENLSLLRRQLHDTLSA